MTDLNVRGEPAMPDDLTALEQRLRGTLHRFDCPTAHDLGDYALDLVPPQDRTRIAAHALDCPRCTDELRTLRSFLRAEPNTDAAQPRQAPAHFDRVSGLTAMGQGIRRIVATLLPPPALAADLRGGNRPAAQTYRAAGLTIALNIGPGTTSGHVSLLGLLIPDDGQNSAIDAARVVLMAGRVPADTTSVDDLGSFSFGSIPAGNYDLELHLAGQVVVIHGLDVES